MSVDPVDVSLAVKEDKARQVIRMFLQKVEKGDYTLKDAEDAIFALCLSFALHLTEEERQKIGI